MPGVALVHLVLVLVRMLVDTTHSLSVIPQLPLLITALHSVKMQPLVDLDRQLSAYMLLLRQLPRLQLVTVHLRLSLDPRLLAPASIPVAAVATSAPAL